MYLLIYTIIIFTIAFLLGKSLGCPTSKLEKDDLEMSEMRTEARKVAQEKVQFRKNKIFNKALEQGRITNNDVEKMFCGISDSSATNYLNRLKKEGLLKQVGLSGRGIYYIPKTKEA